MKVLMINGSPRAEGNTALALREMEAIFREAGVDVITMQQLGITNVVASCRLGTRRSGAALPAGNARLLGNASLTTR